jgi:putative ABC transport system permease protein
MNTVQRQIVLPFSKAIEIAYKSIRLRLSRSLLVTSGIVLALAFLMSILTTDAITESMRTWASSNSSTASQRLLSLMKSNGLPTTAEEIRNDRIQTRWLVGLALLVAFVGILNAMLMSVTERFREIGTMKCLGALDGFIIKLFLIESFFQGIVGTVVGVIVGLSLSLLSQAVTYGAFAWVNFPAMKIVISAGACLVVGMTLTVAGAVYPAWQAARMQPIDAMRVET